MNIQAAINQIQSSGFVITATADGLSVSPASRLSKEQRAFLRTNKKAILDVLTKRQTDNLPDKADDHLLAGIPPDDRRYCRQCRSFRQEPEAIYRGYCMTLFEYQHDDIPRRCDQFHDNGKQPPLGRLEQRDIRAWLDRIGTRPDEIDDEMQRVNDDLEARAYLLRRADEAIESYK